MHKNTNTKFSFYMYLTHIIKIIAGYYEINELNDKILGDVSTYNAIFTVDFIILL
jgi:hypothetical protein